MWLSFNANPVCRRGDDCTVRAISVALNQSWEETYNDLCDYGLKMYDMPSSNVVWGRYLKDKGYTRRLIPDTCPECYTVRDFCIDHPTGRYILALHSHVVAVEDGNYIDSWDSGDEVPIYYWKKETENVLR